jgi:hypothetical protein
MVESRIRFGNINWSKTSAFSEEIPYAPAIWLNLKQREPEGIVPSDQRDLLIEKIIKMADSFCYPWGLKVIKSIKRREDIYTGPFLHLFPDLIIEFNKIKGYTPFCSPCHFSDRKNSGFSKLKKQNYLGRKGSSMPGCHLPYGIFITSVSKLDIHSEPVKIDHVAAYICKILNISPAPWFKTQKDNINSNGTKTVSLSAKNSYTEKEQQLMKNRLKLLGYLDE